jgi:hypothetical protein
MIKPLVEQLQQHKSVATTRMILPTALRVFAMLADQGLHNY